MRLRTASASGRRLFVVLATVGWWWSMRGFGSTDVLTPLGLYACGLVALSALFDGGTLRPILGCDRRAAVVAVAAAALMLSGTYGGYALATELWPELGAAVAGLYRGLVLSSRWTLLWLLPIVLAEEVIFRGLAVDAVGSERPLLSGVVALALFTAAQTGAGSSLVVLLALTCGGLWIALRLWTRSLVVPLLTHALWNLCVLVLWPLPT